MLTDVNDVMVRSNLRNEILTILYQQFFNTYPESKYGEYQEQIKYSEREKLLAYKYLNDKGYIKFNFSDMKYKEEYEVTAKITIEGIEMVEAP